jgi:hypothetical protein
MNGGLPPTHTAAARMSAAGRLPPDADNAGLHRRAATRSGLLQASASHEIPVFMPPHGCNVNKEAFPRMEDLVGSVDIEDRR